MATAVFTTGQPWIPSMHAMRRLLLAALLVPGSGAFAQAVDSIFANGFEPVEVCDGIDNNGNAIVDENCLYCSPPNPTPVCGTNSHCSPQPQPTAYSICSTPAGSKTQGQTCSSLADCASQYGCINNGVAQVCAQWCVRPSGVCPAGTCVGFTTPVYTGATEWGVCL